MNSFWSDSIKSLTPYVPGEQPKEDRLIKLNTNENPYPPSRKVLKAISEAVNDSLRLYPDPDASALKATLAQYHGVNTDQVFVGNGSDEVLAHVFKALLAHEEKLLFPDITYSFYPVYADLFAIDYEQVPLTDDFSIRTQDYIRPNGGIIFPNPNAPTGKLLSLFEIENLLRQNQHSVVVIDEAYIDFGGETAIKLVNQYPNLLVTRTFSKSRSLAGLRVGYAIADAGLIEGLERVKNSFNSYPLDRLAQLGAIASIEDQEYFEQTCEQIIANRNQLTQGLEKLGFEVLPSAANFVLASHPSYPAETLFEQLREDKIIVRYFKQGRIDRFLRITVGSEAECHELLVKLCAILAN